MGRNRATARLIRAGETGFHEACMATLFNQRTPAQFPTALFLARSVEDIQEALGIARQERLRVSIVSGGHSWSANHMRADTLVIDMSRFDAFAVDRASMRALAGPGCYGHELLLALVKQGLFFPTGHCKGVCLGGYLLKGGFGWHSIELGLACESVVGIDLVTADGDVVHASETVNPDLYWAARGAGTGFFGVVFRYHLRLHPKPPTTALAFRSYGLEHLEEVLDWLGKATGHLSDAVELKLSITPHSPFLRRPAIDVAAVVFATSWSEARARTAFLKQAPSGASLRVPTMPLPMRLLYYLTSMHYPAGQRWAVDNIWTGADPIELAPAFRRILDELPPSPSFLHFEYWSGAGRTRPDMAFSMEDEYFLSVMAAWQDPSDDDRYTRMVAEQMRALEPLASGTQLADENLNHRTSRFMSDDNLARLDRLRADWDATGLFNSWHSRPSPAEAG